MEAAWEAPPQKRHSSQRELAVALAMVKGKAVREEAVAEVLNAVFRESASMKEERDKLHKKAEGLAAENAAVGKAWATAKARVQELETDEEKLTGQLDKTMARMEVLEVENEEGLAKVGGLEAQLKQGEKERDALRADAKDLAGRVKELESQLAALSEQST